LRARNPELPIIASLGGSGVESLNRSGTHALCLDAGVASVALTELGDPKGGMMVQVQIRLYLSAVVEDCSVEQLWDGWCGRNAHTLHTRGEIEEEAVQWYCPWLVMYDMYFAWT
jgi:hypothetical protein